MPQKNVVYIFGAGSTIAEALYAGIPKEEAPSLAYISKIVIEKAKKGTLKEQLKEISAEGTKDIELYISLLESMRIKKYSEMAERLRGLFCESIQASLCPSGRPVIPVLENALLQMHKEIEEQEKFAGAISLNYETLLDSAFYEIFGGIDYGINCQSSNSKLKVGPDYPKLIKLHGSFNWKRGFPFVVIDEEEGAFSEQRDMLWIPPSIQKARDSYPFNLLWGQAYEMLNCDILRVIGCKLSQNDWGLLSLLYSTQLETGKPYEIQLINKHATGFDIKERNAFLRNIKLLGQLENCSDFIDSPPESAFEGWLGSKLNTISRIDEKGLGYVNLLLGVK